MEDGPRWEAGGYLLGKAAGIEKTSCRKGGSAGHSPKCWPQRVSQGSTGSGLGGLTLVDSTWSARS